MRHYQGPAVFSFGFRPFFLFASAWAAVSVLLWVMTYVSGPLLGTAHLSLEWHMHEMVFGYLGGVIAGFLLTAVPNWTGRYPVTGTRLIALFSLWVLGRIVMLLPPSFQAVSAVLDSLFLITLASVIAREVITGKNWRNLPVALMTSLLAIAHIAFHLGWREIALHGALAVVMMLTALIGGRIVPSFTRNYLIKQKSPSLPALPDRRDGLVLGITALAMAGWALWPHNALVGGLLLLAGAANLWRLSRWQGLRTHAEALVWILHVGYGWLGLGLVLLGLSGLIPDYVPHTAGTHAMTACAFGVMTLAVMTRASLGHTGRVLHAGTGTVLIYVLINLAAMTRVASALIPALHIPLMLISVSAWVCAFTAFVLVYGPRLLQPKLRAA
ncbi:MAG: NnrS family protein [Asticcacaulis sp.]